MTDALARLRADVSRDDVLRAIQEYDQLGAEQFYSKHGFGPTTTYDLVWEERRYPPKAILGTAYELATGQRLASGDFEGGKAGAVAVLEGPLSGDAAQGRRPVMSGKTAAPRTPVLSPKGLPCPSDRSSSSTSTRP
jgi:hypothetical protein